MYVHYGCSNCFNFVRSSLNKDIDYGTACSEYDGLNAVQFGSAVPLQEITRPTQEPVSHDKPPRSRKRFFCHGTSF